MEKEPILSNSQKSEMVVDSVKMKYLHKFICDVQADGTKLLFVYSPYYKLHNVSVDSCLREMCDDYGITLLNYKNVDGLSTDINYFADTVHLNDEGAIKFTKLLCNEIKKILN